MAVWSRTARGSMSCDQRTAAQIAAKAAVEAAVAKYNAAAGFGAVDRSPPPSSNASGKRKASDDDE